MSLDSWDLDFRGEVHVDSEKAIITVVLKLLSNSSEDEEGYLFRRISEANVTAKE